MIADEFKERHKPDLVGYKLGLFKENDPFFDFFFTPYIPILQQRRSVHVKDYLQSTCFGVFFM